ncbi:MAG: hypothetical protein GC129_00350 [Proteobacteria bacterium]|nr:hypothetical protein [Pseudomonadota bacterium]
MQVQHDVDSPTVQANLLAAFIGQRIAGAVYPATPRDVRRAAQVKGAKEVAARRAKDRARNRRRH